DIEIWDRKKPEVGPEDFNPYEETEDHIPPMPAYGEGYRYHTTGLFHDKTGFPRGKTEDAKKLMDRLMAKIEENMDIISLYETDIREEDEVVVLAYGSTMRSAINAVDRARDQGIKAGWIKLKTLWPFPEEIVKKISQDVNTIIVPELNRGQLIKEVKEHVFGNAEVRGINKYDGTLIKPDEILDLIREVK
ncbi:MAG: transketolase C-terminal domain-containing protein, partial [Bacillota bacterium]